MNVQVPGWCRIFSLRNLRYLPFIFLSFACGERRGYTIHDEELAYVTDSTLIVDIERTPHRTCDLASLLKDVRYIELDNRREAMLSTVTQIRLAGGIMYVMDIDERVKCYTPDGKYVRDAFPRGRAGNEVIRVYDFDTDADFAYVLDGTTSKINIYDHNGTFVRSHRLPFRAVALKKISNGWMFSLSPYTLADKAEKYSLVITDEAFDIKHGYFRHCDGARYARTPCFPNRNGSAYFNPPFGQGIYRLCGDSLQMDYFYDFSRLFPDDREVSKPQFAAENDMYYNYNAVLDIDGYIFNGFYTNSKINGMHVIRTRDGAGVFVDRLTGSCRNVLNFRWDRNVNGYCEDTGEIFGIAPVLYTNDITDSDGPEKIGQLRRLFDDEYFDMLLRDDPDYGANQIIMFARISTDAIDAMLDE